MMGDTLDLTVVLRNTERATRAAEAALAGFQRMEAELSPRMTALEARFSGLEARIPAIAASLNGLARDVLKLNDMLLDHDGRFDGIDRRLSDHDGRFDDINVWLSEHDGRFDAIDKRLDGIEATLAAILARLS